MKKFNFKPNFYLLALLLISLVIIAVSYSYLFKTYLIPFYNNDWVIFPDYKAYYTAANNFLSDSLTLYVDDFHILSYYVYSPLCILLFLPFSFFEMNTSFFLFNFLGIIAFVLSIYFLIPIYEKNYGITLSKTAKIIFYVFSFSLGPLIQNIRFGQPNTILVFGCVLFLYLLMKKRTFWAALVLSLTFWIKPYPLLLFPMLLKEKPLKPAIWGAIAGLIILPLILLPVIPFELYDHFVFSVVFTRLSQTISATEFFKSFPAFLARFSSTPDEVLVWKLIATPLWIKILNYTFFAATYLPLLYFYLKSNKLKADLTLAGIMVVSCLVSYWGEDYTFCMALPLILLGVFIALNQPYFIKILFLFLVLMFQMSKIPNPYLKVINSHVPWFLIMMFHSRYLFASITIFFVSYYLINKRQIAD